MSECLVWKYEKKINVINMGWASVPRLKIKILVDYLYEAIFNVSIETAECVYMKTLHIRDVQKQSKQHTKGRQAHVRVKFAAKFTPSENHFST